MGITAGLLVIKPLIDIARDHHALSQCDEFIVDMTVAYHHGEVMIPNNEIAGLHQGKHVGIVDKRSHHVYHGVIRIIDDDKITIRIR